MRNEKKFTTHVLLCLFGRLSDGKTDIARLLREEYGMKRLVIYTTRNRRPKETDGADYHFITGTQAAAMQEKILDTWIGETEYFALKKDLIEADVAILDSDSIRELRRAFPEIQLMEVEVSIDTATREMGPTPPEDSFTDVEKRHRIEASCIRDYEKKQGRKFYKNTDASQAASEIYNDYVAFKNEIRRRQRNIYIEFGHPYNATGKPNVIAVWSFAPEPDNRWMQVRRNDEVRRIPVQKSTNYIFFLDEESHKVYAIEGARGLASFVKKALVKHKGEAPAWEILHFAYEHGQKPTSRPVPKRKRIPGQPKGSKNKKIPATEGPQQQVQSSGKQGRGRPRKT